MKYCKKSLIKIQYMDTIYIKHRSKRGIKVVEEKFKSIIEKYDGHINSYKKSSDRIGYLRLVAAIGAGYFTYKLIKGQIISSNIFFCVLFYGVFIGLVIYHWKIKEKIETAEAMITINSNYLKRISGEWTTFTDIGEEFIDKNHSYALDLDIVGRESLFQLINTTSTWKGRQTLAKALLEPRFSNDEILQRQRAVEELSKKLELCELMEYQGKRKKVAMESPERLLELIKDKNTFFKSMILKKILYMMPMITIPLAAFIIIFDLANIRGIITILLAIQLLVWAAGLLKIVRVFSAISYFKDSLDEYVGILNLLEKQNFKSEKLCSIFNHLFQKDKSAVKAIKELTRIADKIDIRNNGFFFIFLNGLFLWDYQCVFTFESWKEKYGESIEEWLEDIGEIEALMSISVLNHINDGATFPEISEEHTILEGVEIGHPLIQKESRVNNDIKMSNSIFIITGSNMSGKTTLLRTIGINFSYCGGAISGKYMKCSSMKIYTSMRITDDLKAGISTFYGELVRIKAIIEGAKRNEKMIFLIDEIFRGTNSKDRIEGAQAVLKSLNKDGVIGAITTHDLELCILDESTKIKNYHFEEYYKENKIYFDYILRKGVSTTTNAKYLMEIVGIKL